MLTKNGDPAMYGNNVLTLFLPTTGPHANIFSIPHANLTMAEASFLGKPSIAADTPEAKEYCNNGESALLFQMNNNKDFEEKIKFFLQNIESIESKAQAGKEIVKTMFNSELNSNLLNNLYRNLATKINS